MACGEPGRDHLMIKHPLSGRNTMVGGHRLSEFITSRQITWLTRDLAKVRHDICGWSASGGANIRLPLSYVSTAIRAVVIRDHQCDLREAMPTATRG